MRGPDSLTTDRLLLRRPTPGDEESIYSRYARDLEVTRYLCWSRHKNLGDTRRYMESGERVWQRWPMGPYLIESREQGLLLGSLGVGWETAFRAAVGYVLARDAWNRGYATEALLGLMPAIEKTGVRRVYALCHHEHLLSAHVLEKCGFLLEGRLRRHTVFPNLGSTEPSDVLCYARIMNQPESQGA